MGRSKRKRKHTGGGDGKEEKKARPEDWKGPKQITKENRLFTKYYQTIIAADEWDAFLSHLQQPLPTTFRITGTRRSAAALLVKLKEQFIDKLQALQVDGKPVDPPCVLAWYPDELAWAINASKKEIKTEPQLKAFHQFLVSESEHGGLSRQEAVSMIPPLLLGVEPDHKVLDMCAAPGSKTTQLVEALHRDDEAIPSGLVIANDVDNRRCYTLVHHGKRMQSPCFVVTNYNSVSFPNILLKPKVDGQARENLLFDRILCDVPCTGDGTMRKNLDIWFKWAPLQSVRMHPLQKSILQRGIHLLEVGGYLVYSTCSFSPVENEAVIATALREGKGALELVDVSDKLPLLKRRPGLRDWQIMGAKGERFLTRADLGTSDTRAYNETMFPPSADEAEWMHLERCLRLVPHDQNTGGFFVALLHKTAPISRNEEKRLARSEAAAAAASTAPDAAAAETGPTTATATATATATGGAGMDVAEDDAMPVGLAADDLQKRQRGFKENPYLFLQPGDPKLQTIMEFYGLTEDFRSDLLLSRSSTSIQESRNLYLVSPLVKTVLTLNEGLRAINTGVKVLVKNSCPGVPCDFRLCQEGLAMLSPYLRKRTLAVDQEMLRSCLLRENSQFAEFGDEVAAKLVQVGQGAVLLRCPDVGGSPLDLLAWRGVKTLRLIVAKMAKQHFRLLLGLYGIEEIKYVITPKQQDGAAAEAEAGAALAGEAVPEVDMGQAAD